MTTTVGLGGGCHWCTEAVFASLKGVSNVRQGWIASEFPNDSLSEAVLVDFDANEIGLETLIAIHLYTHSATSRHSMRGKYRSAIYFFDAGTDALARSALTKLQSEFETPVITDVLPFVRFKPNIAEQLDYYFSDPTRPFCEVYINPKLRFLMQKFSANVNIGKLQHLTFDTEKL